MPLGGLETGKNMCILPRWMRRYCFGLQLKFQFRLYGIDVVIPDFSYLVENKDRIRNISFLVTRTISALCRVLKK